MQTGNPALIQLIRTEIENHGPQSFAWFMQQALYHPKHGYYASGRCTIGRNGDYFTNVSVGSVFGQLLAAQFVEVWERLGKPDDFVILEQGAHDGQFACDVLEFLQKGAPEFFAALRYGIVEPFAILKKWQRRTLERFGEKIQWLQSLQPFTGVHFSNELLDAMPVRLIADGREKLVGFQGDHFIFVERERANQTFNHAVLAWVDEVAANLERGFVIAVDYGHLESDFQANVQVRARHRKLDSALEQIGHADITMHVDWRSIVERAQENGLRVAGLTDQHHFVTGIVSEWGRGASPAAATTDWRQSLLSNRAKAKRELQTLLHPELLGRAFQVLALAKNVDPEDRPLAGFQFAREPRTPSRLDASVP